MEEAHGDWQDAIGTLERALTLDKTRETRLKLARLHLLHGNAEDGLGILTEAAGGKQMDPRDAEAIAECQSALNFDPLSAFNVDPLWVCESGRGRCAEPLRSAAHRPRPLPGTTVQARFLKRQLSLPVSTISQ